jgi:DASH complex subunit DAD1
VEALWSQFENFMGQPEENEEGSEGKRKVSGESEEHPIKKEEDDETMH